MYLQISGAILWQYDCGSPVFSSVCCLPEAVCVASVDGCIHCFNFSGNKVCLANAHNSRFHFCHVGM